MGPAYFVSTAQLEPPLSSPLVVAGLDRCQEQELPPTLRVTLAPEGSPRIGTLVDLILHITRFSYKTTLPVVNLEMFLEKTTSDVS